MFARVVSKALLAEVSSEVMTRAARTETVAAAMLMESLASWLKWCAGRVARISMPARAPPKAHKSTIRPVSMLIVLEILRLPRQRLGRAAGRSEPRPLRHRRPPLGQRPPRPRGGETALLKIDVV